MKKDRIIKIVSTIILLTIFFFIIFSLKKGYIERFDNAIYELSQTINSPITTGIFKVVTFLCSPAFIIGILILCLIFIKNKRIKNMIFLNSIFVFVLNQVVKLAVARPRPDESLRLVEETGFSFPSAHAMFSLAFYGLIIYYIYKSSLNKNIKTILTILLCFIIILIPITRIYLGVHYASDVIAGLCLSGAILLIYSLIKDKKA